MTVSNLIIDQLADHALLNYATNPNPLKFAEDAAHMVAKDLAKEHHAEASSAASFTASIKHTTFSIKRSIELSNIAKLETQKANLTRKVDAEFFRQRSQYSEIVFEPNIDILKEYSKIEPQANDGYNNSFGNDDKAKFALNVALNSYLFAYCVAYAAFLFASSRAQVQFNVRGELQNNFFKSTIKERLYTDLSQEPITHNFFIQAMSSDTIWTVSVILLVAGLAALALGVCGLSIPAVGTTLSGMSLNSVIITITGSTMTIASTGLLIGNFFTKRQCRLDNEESQQAIHTMNAIAASS